VISLDTVEQNAMQHPDLTRHFTASFSAHEVAEALEIARQKKLYQKSLAGRWNVNKDFFGLAISERCAEQPSQQFGSLCHPETAAPALALKLL
jgi:hypothetical protein